MAETDVTLVLISRRDAKAAGLKFYFDGKPCPHGHISKKFVANYNCHACRQRVDAKAKAKPPKCPFRIAARATGKTRYNTGKSCANHHMADRFTCNGSCVTCEAEKNARWHASRPGLEAMWARDRRAKDPEPHRADVKRHVMKNPEWAKAALKRWKEENIDHVRHKGRIATANRRTKVAGNGGTFTDEDIRILRENQGGMCAVCDITDRLEIDHIVPIARGGTSDPSNLQLLCISHNRSKGARDFQEWLETITRPTEV